MPALGKDHHNECYLPMVADWGFSTLQNVVPQLSCGESIDTPHMNMITRPVALATIALAILSSSSVSAEGVLDGTLPRSGAQPYRTVRASAAEALLRVERLAPGSVAARAGLRDGDVIVRIDGKAYGGPVAGQRLLEHGRGGRAIELEIRRDGALRKVRYTSPSAPLEDIVGVTSSYESLSVGDGLRLRTITTRPHGASSPLPAIYFVQWLSCDSIEYPLNPEDHGWQQMLQLLAASSGVVMMRTEKAGIGDSDGDCSNLDYDTELAHHRLAYQKLKASPYVDPDRIVLYGASMGGNMAALLAAEMSPAGLVIWGTAIKTWFEHLVGFNRRHLELSGRNPAEIHDIVNRQIAFLTEFAVRQKSPAQIAASDPQLGEVWKEIRGSSGETLYQRPYRFHHQAHAKNWPAAVASVRKPTLVLFGEFDWFEELDDHVLIARLAERSRPGSAKFVLVPGTDHHFSIYPNLHAAYDRKGGLVAPQRPVLEIVNWLHFVVGTKR